MKEIGVLKEAIFSALKAELPEAMIGEVHLEHPEDLAFGDYSTNAALVYAKEAKTSPRDLAERVVSRIKTAKLPFMEKIDIAGPGFINFYFSRQFFIQQISNILATRDSFGKNNLHAGKKVIIEYSTQNVLKQFHIGHLMSNAIGESLSRIIEFSGAEVKRDNYQGDVGLHIAKALWGILALKGEMPSSSDLVEVRGQFLGRAYAHGAKYFDEDEKVKEEIKELNKKIYDRSDPELNDLYDTARAWSLEHFDHIYKRVDTHFDFLFFESETAQLAKEIVEDNITNGVFEKSDGAVIFRGEKYGLHTRVFLSSEGLPVYEAKDVALAKIKYDRFPYDQAIVVTANEQRDYFKVMHKAMSEVFPELAVKTRHLTHGIMKLPSGKMSSRTGNVIPAEVLMDEAKEKMLDHVKDTDLPIDIKNDIAEKVSMGALKYSILHQSLGKDIVFDFEKSLSFEGDSGPYLQYSYARAYSLLAKAAEASIAVKAENASQDSIEVEKQLYRFSEVVEHASREYEPHHIATYLTALAGAFNGFYATTHILDGTPEASYKLAITQAFASVMKSGLWLLGIKAPEKM